MSRYLRDEGGLRPATREKIDKSVAELDYTSATNPGYPDALTGGAFLAESDGPIVLVDGIAGVTPTESQNALASRTGDVRADIFGGTAVKFWSGQDGYDFERDEQNLHHLVRGYPTACGEDRTAPARWRSTSSSPMLRTIAVRGLTATVTLTTRRHL